MLFLDAKWLYNNYLIEYFSNKIYQNPERLARVQENASVANMTLDSMIYLEAKQKSEEIQNSIISKWFVQDEEIDQIIENIKSSP